ncbi:acyl-CoA dehydrogenase/oxidase C-terminal [Syncephalis pseudoplumigaleata]|uniref:Acyl-coenzyme A oxidase n=1 Tax=Syncephalis pseudoplumigaleata TaxID=1712513 RepID=A0A4P9Z1K8_9FUNG|nr:acyl-CoA dehydrogenase/oxidase C-terminal [Syncephalis pseudoplumigaleata]|eukprot:RKP26215.1 acyl-CoA dehydrogenase/oxidase C-terminal [Syncephalis pseudoplumigaleata]
MSALQSLPDRFPSLTADRNATDIAAARARGTCDVEQLADYLYGGREERQLRDCILAILEKEPLFSKAPRYFRSVEEALAAGLAWSRRIIELRDQHRWSGKELELALVLLDEFLPVSIIQPLLRLQCTPEQQQLWLEDAENWRIVGCYAQTELGHGSDLSRLETTATFIEGADEFEISSNGFTGAKWWIGGLGAIATHAIVQARLIIGQKDYGPHMFMVPIRSLEDHRPVSPSITLGNIGPKAFGGTNFVNNGFVYFDRHRIPRAYMLARFARVERDGTYVRPPHAKVGYAGMMLLRISLAQESGWALARAATIAIRYSAVRRQFADAANEEVPVLHYPMVSSRLLPLVAQSHAIIAGGRQLDGLFARLNADLAGNDVRLLPETHALSCCLKSLCTKMAADGMETARRSLGGHGYSAFSGFGIMYGHFVSTNTVEGDNYLITQQTARFLLKILQQHRADPSQALPESADYFGQLDDLLATKCSVADKADWLSADIQQRVMARRAVRLAVELAQLLLQQQQQEHGRIHWSALNVPCWRLSVAHGQCYLARAIATEAAVLARKHSSLAPTMKRLSDLFFLSIVEAHLGDFMEDGSVSPRQAALLRGQLDDTLAELLPEAVRLVDAFDFPDYLLDSALGRRDGQVYRALWDRAMSAPPVNAMRDDTPRSLHDTTPFGYTVMLCCPLIYRDNSTIIAANRNTL